MGSNKVTPNRHNLVQDTKLTATKKLYLDGGGDTFISEVIPDSIGIKVGDDYLLTLTESGDDGNTVLFKTSCAAFTIGTATIDDQDVISGSGHDTEIDFRHSNKIKLSVTAIIPNLNLIFPAGSGNFLLLLTYTGDYSITDWKVYENDESAADGDADVLWPGGTQPNNTASGVDIFSFFYDATAGADKCYGVASLAFATP